MQWHNLQNRAGGPGGGGGGSSGDGSSSGKFGTLSTKEVNKLRGEGLSDETIANNWRKFATDNGGLDDGWEGIASQLAKGQNIEDSMAMTAEEIELQLKAAREMALLNFDLTQQGIEANIDRFPEVSKLGLQETRSQADALNDMLQSEFEATLDEYYPDWRKDMLGAAGAAQADSIAMTERFKRNVLPEAMASADAMSAQALSNARAQLRGELPDDVAAQVRRHAAEISNQIGVRGQAAQFLTARDLGRTSLDMMQLGLENAPKALALGSNAYLGFNQTLQAPVTTGMNATNLIKGYLPPKADATALFSSNLSALQNASIIPAATSMAVNAQVMNSGASLAQQAFTSSLEYNSQQYWNQQNLNMQQKALDAQEKANRMNFAGSVIGAFGNAGAAYLAS